MRFSSARLSCARRLVRSLLERLILFDQSIALDCFGKCLPAVVCHLIILSRRTRLGLGNSRLLPLRVEIPGVIEPILARKDSI
jgi:hypothetical protein